MAGKTSGRMSFTLIEGGEWVTPPPGTRLPRRRGRRRLFWLLVLYGLSALTLGWWLRVLFGG